MGAGKGQREAVHRGDPWCGERTVSPARGQVANGEVQIRNAFGVDGNVAGQAARGRPTGAGGGVHVWQDSGQLDVVEQVGVAVNSVERVPAVEDRDSFTTVTKPNEVARFGANAGSSSSPGGTASSLKSKAAGSGNPSGKRLAMKTLEGCLLRSRARACSSTPVAQP